MKCYYLLLDLNDEQLNLFLIVFRILYVIQKRYLDYIGGKHYSPKIMRLFQIVLTTSQSSFVLKLKPWFYTFRTNG